MEEILLGQVWVAAATKTTPPLMCVVGKIAAGLSINPSEVIVSILVLPHPKAKKDGWPTVSHMPFHEIAFRNSNLSLAKTDVEPGQEFSEGYSQWFGSFMENKAGAFSIPVSEAYEGVVSVQNDDG